MDYLTALKTLQAELPKHGTPDPEVFDAAFTRFGMTKWGHPVTLAMEAAAGIVTSAEALHQAVVPHREPEIHPNVVYTHTASTKYDSHGRMEPGGDPKASQIARNWLIAIIGGLINDAEGRSQKQVEGIDRQFVDASGRLMIHQLTDLALTDGRPGASVRHILKHHTRNRPDGSTHLLEDQAVEDICALIDDMTRAQRDTNASAATS